MDLFILIGRVLLGGSLFLLNLPNLTRPRAQADEARAKGVPAAGLLTTLAGITLLAGSLSIGLGAWPRLGAILAVGFLLPVNLIMHDFWNIEDPQARVGQRNVFLLIVAIIGGAVLFFSCGAGAYSLTLPLIHLR